MICVFLCGVCALEMKTAVGRKIATRKRNFLEKSLRTSLDTVKEWHFIYFGSNEPNFLELQQTGIPISFDNYVSKNWYRIFCSMDNISYLEEHYGIESAVVTPEQKYSGNIEKMNKVSQIIIEVDESFDETHLQWMNYSKVSPTFYLVTVDNGRDAIKQLVSINEVITVYEAPLFQINNRFGVGKVQGNTDPILRDGIYEAPRYLAEYGLEGEGQVITISDSGIDLNSTYFYEENHSEPFDKYMPENRKVVYYSTKYGDRKDEAGHGTHVSGSAAGKALCKDCINALYNGVAPSSKIAFVDIGFDNTMKLNYLPESHLKSVMKMTDSHVSSNSYGIECGDNIGLYLPYDKIKNDLALDMDDSIFIFSAGNSGEYNRSIGRPGTAKNILTVGNMMSPYTLSYEVFPQVRIKASNGSYFYADVANYSYNLINYKSASLYGNVKNVNEATEEDIAYITSDFCQSLKNRNFKAAILYLEDTSNAPICDDVKYPVVVTDYDDVMSSSNISMQMWEYNFKEKMAGTSSRGPTYAGVKKPDVTAVGMAVTSSVPYPGITNHSALGTLAGTSMSAPLVGGSALLIREYFMKGYFMNTKYIPNGATMKAMLIASSQPIDYPESVPIVTEGHGKVNLKNVLNVENLPTKRLGLAQNLKVKSGDHFQAKIKTIKKSPLRIAMAYNDPTPSTDSLHNIIVDVSLYVEAPNSKESGFGNNEEEMESTMESFTLNEAAEGEYILNLFVSGVEHAGEVNVSVVAVGALSKDQMLEFNKSERCPTECKGECVNGLCVCPSNATGALCQIHIENLENGRIEMSPLQIKYMKYTSSGNRALAVAVSHLNPAYNYTSVFLYGGTQKPKTLVDFDFVTFSNKGNVGNVLLNVKKGQNSFIAIYNANEHPISVDVTYVSVDVTLIISIIVVIVIIILASIGVCIWCCVRRKRKQNTLESSDLSQVGKNLL